MPASDVRQGVGADPKVSLQLFMGTRGEDPVLNLEGDNHWGHLVTRLEFSAHVNRGYRVDAVIRDPGFQLLKSLESAGYFLDSRKRPLSIKFQISWTEGFEEDRSTPPRKAMVANTEVFERGFDEAKFTLTCIDPPSYFLNIGDAGGGAYTGKVEEVIKKVVRKYAPLIDVEMSETDSPKHLQHWMMRQAPKTFIAQLLGWSTAFTKKKTKWVIMPEDYTLKIKEQAELETPVKASYLKMVEGTPGDTISQWHFNSNGMLTGTHTKIVTSGLSSSTGEYLDRQTDKQEEFVFIKDSNTDNKLRAEDVPGYAFEKPDDSVGSGLAEKDRTQNIVGWTHLPSIPELYSGGEAGKPYKKYLSGENRSLYLGLLDEVMNMTITVLGHWVWNTNRDLGASVVSLQYGRSDGGFYFISGKWIVNGFRHEWLVGRWTTVLYLSRIDADADAKMINAQFEDLPAAVPGMSLDDAAGLV